MYKNTANISKNVFEFHYVQVLKLMIGGFIFIIKGHRSDGLFLNFFFFRCLQSFDFCVVPRIGLHIVRLNRNIFEKYTVLKRTVLARCPNFTSRPQL